MSLATIIRIHRKQAGLTQIELTDKLGVSIATLRRWEAGETAPTGTRIVEIASLLGISPDGLISDKEGASDGRASVIYSAHENSGGMLVFEGEGTRIELPPTEKGYELFSKLIDNMMQKRGMYSDYKDFPDIPMITPDN